MKLNFDPINIESVVSFWKNHSTYRTHLDELVKFLLLQHTPKIVILLAEKVYFSSQFGDFSPWFVGTIVAGPVEDVLYVFWQQMMEKAHALHGRCGEEGKTTTSRDVHKCRNFLSHWDPPLKFPVGPKVPWAV